MMSFLPTARLRWRKTTLKERRIRMTQKMWVLVNKATGKPIKIWVDERNGYDVYVVGFATRKGLLSKIVDIEEAEEIRKVEFEVSL